MKKIILYLLLILVLSASGKTKKQEDPAFKQYFKAYELVLNSEWQTAISEFNTLIKKFPKSQYIDDSYFWIAYSNQENGDEEDALNLYESFIEDYPKSNLVDDAKKNMAVIAQELVDDGDDSKSKYIQNANAYDKDEIDMQKEVIQAIANDKSESATKKLLSIILSKKRPQKVRESAIFWISQRNNTTIPDLKKVYDSLESEKLKEKVIFSMTQINDPGRFDALYAILKDKNESEKLREKALFWLFQSGADAQKIEPYLNDLIESTKSNLHLREKLMFAIHNSNVKNKAEILYKFALDSKEDRRVREKAIFWLSQNGSLDQIKKLYSQVDDEKLREKMIFSFHQIGSEESIDYLIKLLNLKTTPIKVKKKIIFWLGQSDSDKARSAILNLLED